MQELPALKRGDTFALDCVYSQDGSTPSSIEAITISCHVRKSFDGSLVDTLVVIKSDQLNPDSIGRYVVSQGPNKNTSNWPIGSLLLDFKITIGEVTLHSETFVQPIIESITQ
jgi:hypothetical protein